MGKVEDDKYSKKCGRCGRPNHINSEECWYCNFPLELR